MRPFLAAIALALFACSPTSGPQTGSQTNWLVSCETPQDCGGLECVCGTCTVQCVSDAACVGTPGSSCIGSNDSGSIALCGGHVPPAGLCLPRCDESSCGEGTSCVAGVCSPSVKPSVRVTLDTAARYQTLVGFGASLAHADDDIVAHPQKAALYDLLFAQSGLDALRLRNRYQDPDDQALLPASEIVSAASQRLGRTPLLFISSGTPPAELKANGSRICAEGDAACTLVTLPGGGFDYAGFASYWRSSLDAYASAGITPDYISIQNNPDWVPPPGVPLEACRFLPVEGATTVTVNGVPVEVAYPGYREALAEVESAISDLATVPRIAAPESGLGGVSEYVSSLDAAALAAVAVHFYDLDPAQVDVAPLESLRGQAQQLGLPIFQTEMMAEGLATAILVHHALVTAGASAYFQNNLVAVSDDEASVALAFLTADSFEAEAPFYALSQFAKHTDPGWVRVGAVSDSSELLSSAWLSPGGNALTALLVNSGSEELVVEVALPDELRARLAHSGLTRTVFDGIERSSPLGELSESGIVRVPGGSILSVALTSD